MKCRTKTVRLLLSLCLVFTMVLVPAQTAFAAPGATADTKSAIGTFADPIDLASEDITVAPIPDQIANQITGATPDIVLKDGDYTLVKGTDFEVEYLDNYEINKDPTNLASTDVVSKQPKAIITGKGLYYNQISANFDVVLRTSWTGKTTPEYAPEDNIWLGRTWSSIKWSYAAATAGPSSNNIAAMVSTHVCKTNAEAVRLQTTNTTGNFSIAQANYDSKTLTPWDHVTTKIDGTPVTNTRVDETVDVSTLFTGKVTVKGIAEGNDYYAYNGVEGTFFYILNPLDPVVSNSSFVKADASAASGYINLNTWKPLYTGAAIAPSIQAVTPVYKPADTLPNSSYLPLSQGAAVDGFTLKYTTTAAGDIPTNINVTYSTLSGQQTTPTYGTVWASFQGPRVYGVNKNFGSNSFRILPRPIDNSPVDGADSQNLSITYGIEDGASVVYAGEPVEPIQLRIGSTVLPESDYEVTYENNTDEGLAKATITAKPRALGDDPTTSGVVETDYPLPGNLTGSVVINFNIVVEKDLIVEPIADQNHTGSAIEPALTVKDSNGKVLTKDVEYAVAYTNNIDPGVATATVTGIGSIYGSASGSATFKINFNIVVEKDLIVEPIADQNHTGSAIEPALTVKDSNGKVLTKDVEYAVAYTNNIDPGVATATVTGIGSIYGSASGSATFKINKDSDNLGDDKEKIVKPVLSKLTISKLTAAKKKLTITWKKSPASQKIGGYELRYKVKGSKWKTVKVSASKAKLVLKKLKKGKKYQVQVRTYKKVSGKKYTSTWSATKTSKKIK